MSLATIRSLLETTLGGVTPAVATAHENQAYSPVPDTPYQRVTLLTAQPDNPEIGPGYIERGILQVDLAYPKDKGPKDALARAALIRAAFPFAASFTSGSITVNIIATPEISPARTEDDRYVVPIRVRWHARIGG